MNYSAIQLARFLERSNRFIARCRLIATDEEIIVHVKNTGRCKELLIPGVTVAVNYQPAVKRKTAYDLIAVKKNALWINIDSQIPNALAAEGILSGLVSLPGIEGALSLLKREVTYGHSKFDLYFETDQQEKGFVEVKGMTLENQGVGAFPDAPTMRGLKHVEELQQAQQRGYHCFVLFIVQFPKINVATIHSAMQPALSEAIKQATADGVQILAYNCEVDQETIALKGAVTFDLNQPFIDPNQGKVEKA
ncbi:DNA/RNA nuclease SfsA [Enterococcus hermanniensis]|uniref:Sugar fermentation stimulation protein homolog n=1 Tax=Enterococcus hermanniensis TaxID=249189 RepID=A0A1L8TR36_9ENTE|nr:DNA/RNA nuclease SfsA [Enterococcus hermanniensis]OJG46775.1 sugar fermentation stimulation protein [Enterococcus hermanniensis]